MCQQLIERWIESGPLKGVFARKIAAAAQFDPTGRWLLDMQQGSMAVSLSLPDRVVSNNRVAWIKAYWPRLVAARIDGVFRNFRLTIKEFLLRICPQLFVWTLFISWLVGGFFLGANANQPEFVVVIVTGALWVLRLSLITIPVAFSMTMFEVANILNSPSNDTKRFCTGVPKGSFESLFEAEFNQLLIERLVADGTISRDGPVTFLGMSRIEDQA